MALWCSVRSDSIRYPFHSFRVPGVGWRLDGTDPVRRAVLAANSLTVRVGSGVPRCLRWLGFAMWTARTWISSGWTTVRAGMASKARQRRGSSAALDRRSLLRVPVLSALNHSPVSHLASYQPARQGGPGAVPGLEPRLQLVNRSGGLVSQTDPYAAGDTRSETLS